MWINSQTKKRCKIDFQTNNLKFIQKIMEKNNKLNFLFQHVFQDAKNRFCLSVPCRNPIMHLYLICCVALECCYE